MAPMLMKVVVDGAPDATDGDFILVEVDRQDAAGAVQLAGSEVGDRGVVVQAQETLERSFERLTPALSVMLRKLRSAENSPDHIQMEFGLKLGGTGGFIFAKGTAEVNFAVTVTWEKPVSAAHGDESGSAR